jgi:hypothetical protein
VQLEALERTEGGDAQTESSTLAWEIAVPSDEHDEDEEYEETDRFDDTQGVTAAEWTNKERHEREGADRLEQRT